MKTTRKSGLVIAAFCLAVSSASADVLIGTNFDVIYNPAAVGLFGPPTIGGNTVFFTPTEFKAESLNGVGTVTTSQTISFDIVPHENFRVTGSGLTERGDYVLRNATSTVDVQGQTSAYAIANPLLVVTDNIAAAGPMTTLNISTDWTATSFLNLTPLPSDGAGYRITIDNHLIAYTDPNATGLRQAFIEKKFVGESVGLQFFGTVNAIPEPQTYVLFLAGFGLLGFLVRRRRVNPE
jgi:hypothetical protein